MERKISAKGVCCQSSANVYSSSPSNCVALFKMARSYCRCCLVLLWSRHILPLDGSKWRGINSRRRNGGNASAGCQRRASSRYLPRDGRLRTVVRIRPFAINYWWCNMGGMLAAVIKVCLPCGKVKAVWERVAPVARLGASLSMKSQFC